MSMATAAVARRLGAALRRVDDGKDLKPAPIILYLPALLAGALIIGAAFGFAVTRLSESRSEAARYAALHQALDELRIATGEFTRIDDAQLRTIGRRIGVDALRFEADPTRGEGRAVQSLHDARGRIVGWFTWAADDAVIRMSDGLWLALAIIGAAFAAAGLVAARASRKVLRLLDRSAERARRLTGEDPLTGLPNHGVVLERLNEALARRRSGVVVFALVDLDSFREVNDTLGRRGGDTVIQNVADHLQAGLPAGASIGRFEEDEFAVIVTSESYRAAANLVDAIRVSLQRPIFVERLWQITACIGVAQAPQDGAAGDEIARRAGLALRAAKREGRARVRSFEPQIETASSERRYLLHELQSAISRQTFDVHYQPIVAAGGSAIIGVEALLRWTHSSRGAIPPSVFIPLAEQNGLMPQLGEIVLRRALTDAERWPGLSIAINLSPLQIRDRAIVDLVGAVMAETGVASSRVVLEVTEGVLIDNPEEALARLEALQALGVSIALDDFGTGFSSLSYLQKFPFGRIKIDRAFVASLGTSGSAGAIIQSIVTLGHGLGMKVLAEGVERDEQRVLLRLAGCDEMQGFLFARPGPASDIDMALARAAVSAAG